MSDDRPPAEPISLEGMRTTHLGQRQSKVALDQVGRSWERGGTLLEFVERLPAILGAADLKEVVRRISEARKQDKTVLLGMGAHAIKVGLSPVIIDLMQRRILTGVAFNGAGIIHDTEIALAGKTSEEVGPALADGSFGMSHETAEFLNVTVARAAESNEGLGAAVGRALLEKDVPHVKFSILAAGARLGIPVTVHVALGTDTIHIHPSFDAAATGQASHLDFRIFAGEVATLKGGVYLNLGSAVLMPEVFLKALTLVRNLGHDAHEFTTINMDFMRHYRPRVNVVQRPTEQSGKGFELIGHHEIMLPLLAAAIIESMDSV
jgi:hypothetical protein